MAQIRKIEISNFRSLKSFQWCPSSGINCLIGPGDSGKSTILDAIDFCLGARRTVQFNDADFANLNVDDPISITLTIGELSDALKNIDHYGLFLRGLNPESGDVEDEPRKNLRRSFVSISRLVVIWNPCGRSYQIAPKRRTRHGI